VYLFSGRGFGNDSSSGDGFLNDIWYFNTSSLLWKWVKGPSIVNQIGIYGSLGIESTENTHDGREVSIEWTDAVGNPYVFSGAGNGSFFPLAI
jgi:hypothetical protein